MLIRYASEEDVERCKVISSQFPRELPFINRAQFQQSISKRELFVAFDTEIVGFIRWHACRDGWSTVYDLAVDKAYHGQGIGRMLLYAVPCPIRLKTTEDNASANQFYKGAGMLLAGQEQGKHRALNCWTMRILNIIVRGNNPSVVDICRKSGSAYGVKYDHSVHAWPFMIDSDPDQCDWAMMLSKVVDHRPVQALTADYYPGAKSQMEQQVRDLRGFGVLRICICPKFHGAVDDIPRDCIIALSLRTNGNLADGDNKYAGFMPNFAELTGRKVHLLGGSPQLQKRTIVELQGVGIPVLSVDGNGQFGASLRGTVYSDGKWRRSKDRSGSMESAQLASSVSIQRELNEAAQMIQYHLF